MKRTTLVPVTFYLVVAAWGFGHTSPVEAFQAESENLWLLLLQKAELENTYGSDHPKVASFADRIQSARDRLSASASVASGTNTEDDSGGNIPGVHVQSAPHLPTSTAIDQDAVPAASATLTQPATSAAKTMSDSESLPVRARRSRPHPLPAKDAALPGAGQDAELRLYEMMRTERIGKLNFPGITPLTEILDEIASDLTARLRIPVLLELDVAALEEQSVSSLDDILINDINIPNGLMTVGSALDDVLSQTDPELTWIVQNELILITTMTDREWQDRWIVRVYDVASLRPSLEAAAVARNLASRQPHSEKIPADGGGFGGGGSGFFQLGGTQNEHASDSEQSVKPGDKQSCAEANPNQETPPAVQPQAVTWQECLLELVQNLTWPVAKWPADEGQGFIKIIENSLIIRQTRKGHERVADVLDLLTLSLTNTDATGPSSVTKRLPFNPIREFSRGIDRDSEQKLNEMLWTERTPELMFPGATPLTKILDHISAVFPSRVDLPLRIMPDIGALEDDSVVLNDVVIQDVEIPDGLTSVGGAIKHILSQTDPELSLIARDGILLLTTKTSAEAEENSLLRVYDISRLLAAFRNPQSPESVDPWQIPEIVQAMSAPPARWFDIDGEGGRLYILGERLVVTQSPEGHQRIADCLEQLELSLNAAAFGSQSEPVMRQPLNPIREFTQESERHAESRLHEFLWSERNPELHFPGATTLLKVLAVVSEKLSKPVLFKPDFLALEADKISSLDDVKIKDLNVDAGRMSIGAALDEILSHATPKLQWIVKNNIVLLTSSAIAESEENQYLRIYNLSRIRALTATSGAKVFPSGASICSVISHMTTPVCRWFETDGEGGRMVIAGDQLIVRQTRHGHQLVADILTRLVMPGRKP